MNAGVATSLTIATCGERGMNIQQHDGFYVVGLTARTNNAQEMSGRGKIGECVAGISAA